MATSDFQARWSASMMTNYGVPPIAIASGAGSRVTDVDGNTYLDFVGGIAVSSLGHAHPAIVDAVTRQVGILVHTSNLAMHEPGLVLAEKLRSLTGDMSARVFFCNDGTEANECAIKIARLHGRAIDPSGGKLGLVSTNNSFHGRTLGSLALTGTASKREPFEPLPGGVTFVDYGDLDALKSAVDQTTAAVFLEPTQGEGGIVPAPGGYLTAAREICDSVGALLVIDEVQSGIGRTGEWFASLAAGVKPDVISLAKGLGGGIPIGASIAFRDAATLLQPGSHGTTFGGNPVACAAALAVIDTIERSDVLGNVKARGAELEAGLKAISSPLVETVRGSGLWWGVVLTGEHASSVETQARSRGLLVNAVKPNVLRLAPPLIVSSDDVDEAVSTLAAAIADVEAQVNA